MSPVVIREEEEALPEDTRLVTEFTRRHPLISYLFGDMVRGFYLLGCLSLDLLGPVQVRMSFPGNDLVVLPLTLVAIAFLMYAEWRLYRKLWPRSRKPDPRDSFVVRSHRKSR